MIVALLAASLLGGMTLAALGWLVPAASWAALGVLTCGVIGVACWERRTVLWLVALAIGAGCLGLLAAPSAAGPGASLITSSLTTVGPAKPGALARVTLGIDRSGCGEAGCFSEGWLRACSEVEPGSCVEPGTQLTIASAEELPRGATLRALATLRPRATFHNPHAGMHWPDLRPTLHASLQPGSLPAVEQASWLDLRVFRLRVSVRALLGRELRAPHAGIARALLLGDAAAVDRDLNEAIRFAGVSHVLAVSGMHVTLLVGALVAVVQRAFLWSPLGGVFEARRVGAAVGALLAPLVASLCGAAPSAVRAAWTSALIYFVIAMGYRPCALSVTALVVAVHALRVPSDALHPGFVLSVLATAALLSHRAQGTAVVRAARESLRAWLATAPFLLLCFGQTSLVALVANVALLPLGTALVPLAAVHLGVSALSLHTVLPTAPLFELASGAFVAAARHCAQLDPGLVLPPLTPVQVLAAWTAAGACMLPGGLRVRLGLTALATLAACLSEWSLRHALAPDALRVTFLDVGQGDGILLETGGGVHALIDAGGSLGGGADPGARAVLPLLRARRIEALDLVVLSHPHPDHYGGLAAVLEALPVRELWDTGQAEAEASDDEHGVATLLATARKRGVRVRRPESLCDALHGLGRATLRVLSPCPSFDLALGPNDNSFVLRLAHGARSVLLTGDVEQATEAALVARGAPLQSDVLKVAHHGSRTSSDAALLAAVAPALAVISAGRGNRFGHPHPEVLARLRQAGSQVLRTDLHGGISLESDGRRWQVVSAAAPASQVLAPSAGSVLAEPGEHERDGGDHAQQQCPAGQAQ